MMTPEEITAALAVCEKAKEEIGIFDRPSVANSSFMADTLPRALTDLREAQEKYAAWLQKKDSRITELEQSELKLMAERREAQANSVDEHFEMHAACCSNCGAEILARLNGKPTDCLSDGEESGDLALCGACMGKEFYDLEAKNAELFRKDAEMKGQLYNERAWANRLADIIGRELTEDEKLDDVITTIQGDLSELTERLFRRDAQIAELKESDAEAWQEVERSGHAIVKANKNINALRAERLSKEAEISALSTELTAGDRARIRINDENQALRAEVERLKKDVEGAKEALLEAKDGFDSIAYAHSMKAEFHESDWMYIWQCTFDDAWNHRAKVDDAITAVDAALSPAAQPTPLPPQIVIRKGYPCRECCCSQTLPVNLQQCACKCHPRDREEAPAPDENGECPNCANRLHTGTCKRAQPAPEAPTQAEYMSHLKAVVGELKDLPSWRQTPIGSKAPTKEEK